MATVLLVALTVLSPWPFGSVHLRTVQLIAFLGSVGGLLGLAASATADHADTLSSSALSRRAIVAVTALWSLGVLQLAPLPATLHGFVAPGSAAVWHPASPAAAAVLGASARPITVDPAATVRWLAFAGGVAGLALAARRGLQTRTALLRAAVAVVAGGLLVAVYGIAARLLFGDKLYGVLQVPTIAPFGPFVSKNHFAGYVELAACLALGLAAGLADEARRGPERLSWLESRRAAWIVAAWGAAATLVLAVPASLSRGGVVSLAAGMAAFAAIRISTRQGHGLSPRSAMFGAAGLLAAVAVVGGLVSEEARARVLSLGSLDSANAYRLSVWRDTLPLFASSPALGSGLGAFEEALPRFKTGAGDVRVEHAENDYFELLCEGGVIGLGLALVAAFSLLASGWRAVGDERHRLARGVRAGALAGLCALAVHSAFDFNLRIPSNALLAALLVAIVLPTYGSIDPDPSADPGAGRGAPDRRRTTRRLGFALPVATALAIALFGPWNSQNLDLGVLRRAPASGGSGLRSTTLERDFALHLQRRPADAPVWAALAWLRLPRAPQDADALAAWSQTLDPQDASMHAAAQRIRDAASASPSGPAHRP